MITTNPLMGRVITAIEIAADKKAMRFVLADGECIVKVDGDCCSDTWIEHVDLPALGFPATVTSVDDLELRSQRDEESYETTQFYGCKVTTDRGEIVIDYRNSSNGYYGGSLHWPNEDNDYYYGGVFQQNVSKLEWKPLTA